MRIESLPPRMAKKITTITCSAADLEGDCWQWTAAVTSSGYGSFCHNGRTWSSHRLAYELLVGPILAGLFIDHRCLNKLCCNPSHLEPVTNAENIRRGRVSNWALYGSYIPHFEKLQRSHEHRRTA